MLAQGPGGRLRPRPPHFEIARIRSTHGTSSAEAGASILAQELAQRPVLSRPLSTTTPNVQPLWQTSFTSRLVRLPCERRLLLTNKASAPTTLACDPRPVTPTKPSSVHASVLTAKATKNTSPIVDIEVLVYGFSFKLALRAGKLKGTGLETQEVSSKAPNDIRVETRLKVPPSMLLERAVCSH